MPRIRARLKGLRHREGWNFSPLFIGESSLTAREPSAKSTAGHFSPLFIGESSLTPGSAIPTSSPTYFSPLFIGESSLTSLHSCIGLIIVDFSPLFIGESSLTRLASRFWSSTSNFSPLFIGESSLTFPPLSSTTQYYQFQSPLHRGVLFNPSRPAPQAWVPLISVPSSSGSPL